jgi:hypothetical protein
MCLENVKHKAPKIATKDIICYKLLYITPEGEYITPFKRISVNLNEVIQSFLDSKKGSGVIYKGIHTFGKLSDAKKELEDPWYIGNSDNTSNCPIILVRAKIPIGSLYWIGRVWSWVGKNDFNWTLSYCSNQIIYEKILKV